mmetsp:Transcript_7893/g.15994  ORF Transcript_7893/g.15994 Transcript_7893/m.15994 type:complete len:301 (+) Transcript_7893:63-965(+)
MDSPSKAAVAAKQHKHKDTATALEALLEIKHSPSFTPVPHVDGFGVAQGDVESFPNSSFTGRSVAPAVLNNLQMPAPPAPPSSTSNAMAGITKLLAPRQGPVPSVSPTAHLQIPQPHGVLGHHRHPQLFAGGTSNRQEQHRHQAILASAAAAAHGIALGNVVANVTADVTSSFPINHHPSSSFSTKRYPADGVVAAEPGDPSTADTGTSAAVPEANTTVREDEIKAALESRPQRGKKRDNLTALERKELTKTRNREHARSTRYVPSPAVLAQLEYDIVSCIHWMWYPTLSQPILSRFIYV